MILRSYLNLASVGKCFSQAGNLRLCKRVHTERKPYECKLSENRLLKVPSKHHLLPIKRHLRALYHKLPLFTPPPPPPPPPVSPLDKSSSSSSSSSSLSSSFIFIIYTRKIHQAINTTTNTKITMDKSSLYLVLKWMRFFTTFWSLNSERILISIATQLVLKRFFQSAF